MLRSRFRSFAQLGPGKIEKHTAIRLFQSQARTPRKSPLEDQSSSNEAASNRGATEQDPR
jgi:hypothetical protein